MQRNGPTILLLLLLPFVLSGCLWAATPTNRLAQMKITLTGMSESLLSAHTAGIIDDDQMLAMDKPMQTGFRAVELAEQHLLNDPKGGTEFQEWLRIAEIAVTTLQQLETENASHVGPSDNSGGSEGALLPDRDGDQEHRGGPGVGGSLGRTAFGDRRGVRVGQVRLERPHGGDSRKAA